MNRKSLALAAALACTAALPAHAAVITVTTTSVTPALGLCTLPEAIANANNDTDTTGGGNHCPAGSGIDTIKFLLPGGAGTIVLTSTLSVSSILTVDGSGQDVAISGGDGVPVLDIAPGGYLTLLNLAITHGAGDATHASGISDRSVSVPSIPSENYTLILDNVTLSDHSASAVGSALHNASGNEFLTFVSLTDNAGTAIRNDATLTLNLSTVRDNGGTAAAGGPAIRNTGALTVGNTYFEANDGGTVGAGAIENSGAGIALVLASTFTANKGTAAPLSNAGTGSMTLINGTLVDDLVNGGMHGKLTNSGTLKLVNTTLSGDALANTGTATAINSIFADSGTNCVTAITDGGNNLSDDATCGFSAMNGSLSATPAGLAPALADNGGPFQPDGPVLPTLALLAGSAAIDAANDTTCSAAIATGGAAHEDARGYHRPHGAHCDMGAFEFGARAGSSGSSGGLGGALGVDLLALLALAGLRRRRGR